MDLGTHVVLFVVVALAIVLVGTLFAEPDDAKALRALPRRLVVFCVGCGVLTAIMLLIEHTVASVD